ncbi:MAG: AAA family ATPase [Candidatus Roizmanbacteria bacterium]|nr:MAG: AAA family ATPase [Candidatus Roizmanbacteria bacterium]
MSFKERGQSHPEYAYRHDVVSRLESFHGGKVYDQLKSSILGGEETVTLLIGPPGVGKSTVAEQLRHTFGGVVNIKMLTFDSFLKRYEGKYGPRENWTKGIWLEMNEDIANSVQPPYKPAPHKVKIHELDEIVGVGGVERDRARTALEKIVAVDREVRDDGKIGKIRYVFFVPDPRVQGRVGEMRTALINTEPKKVRQVYRDNYLTIVTGNSKGSLFDSLTEEEKGRCIQEMTRRSARQEHILTIQEEINKEYRMQKNELGFDRIVSSTHLHMAMRTLPDADQRQFMMNVLYTRYLAEVWLRIPRARLNVVVNPIMIGGVTIVRFIDDETVRDLLCLDNGGTPNMNDGYQIITDTSADFSQDNLRT